MSAVLVVRLRSSVLLGGLAAVGVVVDAAVVVVDTSWHCCWLNIAGLCSVVSFTICLVGSSLYFAVDT